MTGSSRNAHSFLCRNMAGGLFEGGPEGNFFRRGKEERV